MSAGRTTAEMREFFEYLDRLRESGVTNMFGVGPYLSKEFGLDRKEEGVVLLSWMATFSKGTMDERVMAAMEEEQGT